MMRRIITVCMAITLSACAHQSMTWDRTAQAAQQAAVHPSVWGPLLGAGVFSIDHLDKRTSKELSEHTPVFGSDNAAAKASTDLKEVLADVAIASALVAPVPEGENAIEHRGEHLAVIFAGFALNGYVTDGLKNATHRQRPNQEDDKSFPSYNASKAFLSATFASDNFHLAWGDGSKARWADAGLYTAASLEALTRVELEKHYPTDVLVGASLGNFLARFLDGLFLQDSRGVSLSAYYDGKAVMVGISQGF